MTFSTPQKVDHKGADMSEKPKTLCVEDRCPQYCFGSCAKGAFFHINDQTYCTWQSDGTINWSEVGPVLLEALEKIIEHVENMDAPRQGNQCTLCHTYRMIGHDAIAKVRGAGMRPPRLSMAGMRKTHWTGRAVGL